MSMKMTKEEREAFLADLHVGVLGVNHGDIPLAVPIWYDYEPGGDVWLLASPESIKCKGLEATGQFSLCAQTETCLLYTSPSPRDKRQSRMPSSA